MAFDISHITAKVKAKGVVIVVATFRVSVTLIYNAMHSYANVTYIERSTNWFDRRRRMMPVLVIWNGVWGLLNYVASWMASNIKPLITYSTCTFAPMVTVERGVSCVLAGMNM